MLRAYRLVLISILAMSIPVHGLAAAAMALCGQAQHGAQRAEALQAEPTAQGDAQHQHRHHEASVQSLTGDGLSADPGATASSAPDHKTASQDSGHECSACASCCAGLALPSTASPLAIPDQASEFSAARSIRVAMVVIDGPLRPPRAIPA